MPKKKKKRTKSKHKKKRILKNEQSISEWWVTSCGLKYVVGVPNGIEVEYQAKHLKKYWLNIFPIFEFYKSTDRGSSTRLIKLQ